MAGRRFATKRCPYVRLRWLRRAGTSGPRSATWRHLSRGRRRAGSGARRGRRPASPRRAPRTQGTSFIQAGREAAALCRGGFAGGAVGVRGGGRRPAAWGRRFRPALLAPRLQLQQPPLIRALSVTIYSLTSRGK